MNSISGKRIALYFLMAAVIFICLIFLYVIKNQEVPTQKIAPTQNNTATQTSPETQVQNVSDAVSQVTLDGSIATPPSANPVQDATPGVNPIEKTNPFNNEYQNPF